MTPVASIIIATFNHAQYLRDAIDGALAQTAPCEVIVIDDGSTDATPDVVAWYGERIRAVRIEHAGVCAARNRGIEEASADFVMFLDADDLIDRRKVEMQLAEMRDEAIGWVLCDVRIDNASTRSSTIASKQYRYDDKVLAGWIQPLLALGNFIPIMSPLVRRSVLATIRFSDGLSPEDWHFWHAVAGEARVRYVPHVLATYRHQRTGRSREQRRSWASAPNVERPLRLNLGCGTPGTRSWHPIPGMLNLDKSLGWCFEDGLGDFVAGSVAGITVSHALMYVAREGWPALFADFARVLEPGGVIRITEDDATNPQSARYGGWKGSEPAVTLIDAAFVRQHLEAAGLQAHDVTSIESHYRDLSLCQAQHGEPPDVFFIEGVRETSLLFEPHADDGALFSAFNAVRYKPRIVTCFPSSGDYGDTEDRAAETRAAAAVLGAGPCEQWDGKDIAQQMRELDARMHPTVVFAPSAQTSHPDHAAVAVAAAAVFGDRVVHFHTYDAAGKVRTGTPVAFDTEWLELKRRALQCYRSQIEHPRARVFFDADLCEYRE